MRKKVIVTLGVLFVMSAAWTLLVYTKRGRAQPSSFVLGTNAGSYLVNEFTTYKIFGAPPNAPVYWSSTFNNQPTPEVDAYYGHVTDGQGNWEGEMTVPWNGGQVGNWTKTAKVGGLIETTGFNVIDGDTWSCNGSVSDCLRIAKEKGSTKVWLPEPRDEGCEMTTDFDEIKDKLLVVRYKTGAFVSLTRYYDTQLDRILSYDKFKAEILHEPPHPCTQCTSPPNLPPGLSAGPDELILVSDGAFGAGVGINIDGINFFTMHVDYPPASEFVCLLVRNEYNPRVVGLAFGKRSVFPVAEFADQPGIPYMFDNDYLRDLPNEGDRIHALISLNQVPWDPNSSLRLKLSDFINLLNN